MKPSSKVLSVLEQIENRRLLMQIYDVSDNSCPRQEKEILRLAKLGAEAEKASKRCADYPFPNKCLVLDCGWANVCKMAKENAL